MCVCMCVCVCIYLCVCVCIYLCLCMFLYLCVCVRVCIYISLCVYISLLSCVRVCICVNLFSFPLTLLLSLFLLLFLHPFHIWQLTGDWLDFEIGIDTERAIEQISEAVSKAADAMKLTDFSFPPFSSFPSSSSFASTSSTSTSSSLDEECSRRTQALVSVV